MRHEESWCPSVLTLPLQALADEQGEELLLERFVLNRLNLVLDGPARMVEVIS